MTTLIIPCAGKSTRFPNMKPKWLLTHPDGKLMIEKSLEGLDLNLFKRIIITIVKEHNEMYEAEIILSQVFKGNRKIEICILDNFTKSASETIFQTIEKMNISGSFVIKDSDNFVKFKINPNIKNFIVGYNLHNHNDITNIPAKSFLIVNNQNIIQDIIEKKIVSNTICLGVYGFKNAEDFKNAFKELIKQDIKNELFVSYIISYILSLKKSVFEYIEAQDYRDWGTLSEWEKEQEKYKTFFIDVDGVILKNSGKYGSINWKNNFEVIKDNVETIKNLQKNGAQIIITTSRQEEYRKDLENLLTALEIRPYQIIMGLNHSMRVIINDFAPTNPYPSAVAISIPRNTSIKNYIK